MSEFPKLNSVAQQMVVPYRRSGSTTFQIALMIGMAKLHPKNYAYAVHTRAMADFVLGELRKALPEAEYSAPMMEFRLPNGSRIRVFSYKETNQRDDRSFKGLGDWEIVKDHAAP